MLPWYKKFSSFWILFPHKPLVFTSLLSITLVIFLTGLLMAGREIVSSNPSVAGVSTVRSIELLTKPWRFEGKGNKRVLVKHLAIPTGLSKNSGSLRITYNLHGLCVLPKVGASLMLNNLKELDGPAVSFIDYGKNCFDGDQTIEIALADFSGHSGRNPVNKISVSTWYPTAYWVDIKSIQLVNASLSSSDLILASKHKTPQLAKMHAPKILLASSIQSDAISSQSSTITSAPTVVPSVIDIALPSITKSLTEQESITPTVLISRTPDPTIAVIPSISATLTPTAPLAPIPIQSNHSNWAIRSVSSMKVTKDAICSQPSTDFIVKWVDKAVELGVTYISIEQPYDSPPCGDSVAYTKRWVTAIRSRGLYVWHRHMPLAFEGIYNTVKDENKNYISQITDYIRANPSVFSQGDIFTPIPEPQNGGIRGVNYCSSNVCIFSGSAHFNKWLRDAMQASSEAFAFVGLAGKIYIGYWGFDGYIAWGDNNPDWGGILEDETVVMMGNITIDHYPEIVGDSMENDLNELSVKYPNVPIVIGEWGTITGGDTISQVRSSMGAAVRPNVIGFNYWHMGMGGNEALIHEDFSPGIQYFAVQSFYR